MGRHNWSERTKVMYQARTTHYISYLRVPLNVHEKQIRKNVTLVVFEYPPRSDRPFCTYVTSGMSEMWQSTPQRVTLFTELLFYLPTMQSWAIDFLVKLAEYPFQYHTFYAPGQTMPMEGPLVPGSQLTSLLLLPPLLEEPGIRLFHEISSKQIELMWVVPIYEVERQYIIAHGHGALLDRVTSEKLEELRDPLRHSFV